jgi:hypothetical protein
LDISIFGKFEDCKIKKFYFNNCFLENKLLPATFRGLTSVAEFGTEFFRRTQNKLSKKNVQFAQNQQLSQAAVVRSCDTQS